MICDSLTNASPRIRLSSSILGSQGAGDAVAFGGGGLEPGTIRIEGGRQFVNYSRPPLWIYTSVIYAGLIALGLWRASAIVSAPTARLRARGPKAPPEPVTVVVDGTS